MADAKPSPSNRNKQWKLLKNAARSTRGSRTNSRRSSASGATDSSTDFTTDTNQAEEFGTYGDPLGELEMSDLYQRHPTNPDEEEEQFAPEKETKLSTYLRGCWKTIQSKFTGISQTNLKMGGGMEAGNWDNWGIYYCSDRFGRHTKFNSGYFAIASIFMISQASEMDAVGMLHNNGGLAFVPAVLMVYLTLGYPMYIVETTMGQYSGRKPIQMTRHLLPGLSGLGMALYLRTIAKAINSVAVFIYSAYVVFSMFFCRSDDNRLLRTFLEAETRQKEFTILYPNGTFKFTEPVAGIPNSFVTYFCIIAPPILLFVLVFQGLRFWGKVLTIVARIMILMMIMYFVAGVNRVSSSSNYDQESKILFYPLKKVLSPRWEVLFTGKTWMEATHFVIQAMELGTLVHTYLGSKIFFHYRCPRDGVGLVGLSVMWHLISGGAILLWMGYVGINTKSLEGALSKLKGQYGLFVVYGVTHMAAELTEQIQGDVLFYCGFFYSIIGIVSLLASVIYLIVIIDCSYPEYGHMLVKIGIMGGVCLAYGIAVPFFVLQKEGLRWVTWLDFYVEKSWAAPFIVGTYSLAVGMGHETGRYLHDFLNMIHLRRYHSRQHFYAIPKILSSLIFAAIVVTTIGFVSSQQYPKEGMTNWKGSHKWVGQFVAGLPCICVVMFWLYTLTRRNVKSCRPHRDWFKNKHHQAVCFADFKKFRGIPGLVDPEEGGIGGVVSKSAIGSNDKSNGGQKKV